MYLISSKVNIYFTFDIFMKNWNPVWYVNKGIFFPFFLKCLENIQMLGSFPNPWIKT